MPADVVIITPVLARPHRIGPLMASVAAATPEPYRLLFVATGDDDDERAELERLGADYITPRFRREWGDYAAKTNAGITASTEALVFTGADDLSFHPGWLAAARRRLGTAAEWVTDPAYPDARIGVVGTNDLGNPDVVAGTHSTHSLVTRAYIEDFGTYDQPGVLLHPGYDHNYCDIECIETAKVRCAFVHAADSVVEHFHPSWDKAPTDRVYDLGRERWHEDARLWRRRRRGINTYARLLHAAANARGAR